MPSLNFLKKPFEKIKTTVHSDSDHAEQDKNSSNSSLTDEGDKANPKFREPEEIERDRRRRSEEKSRKRAESLRRHAETKKRDEDFLANGPQEIVGLYKPLSLNMSKHRQFQKRVQLRDLDLESMDGQEITFQARIHTIRPMSAKLVFVVFRQQTDTIQGVLAVRKESNGQQRGEDTAHDSHTPEAMIRSIEHYPLESIVLVKGNLRQPPQRIKNATIHNAEVDVHEVHLVSQLTENVPFSVYDAENIGRNETATEKDKDQRRTSRDEGRSRSSSPDSRDSSDSDEAQDLHDRNSTNGVSAANHQRSLPQRVRLSNRIIDLRTAPSQSIFRIQSGICNMFRSYLDSQGFIEIHTPKLQAGATESGSTVFEVKYFGRPAFLAQSPQLAKQMCISADFGKVYEIGPVFRAEDSNTPRHMTEYTGLDLEMALDEHYHEALELIDDMFKNLWKGIYERYSKEIDTISEFYPQKKVEWIEKTPRIPFKKGIEMLNGDGWTDEEGNPASATEDLPTRAEIRLGQLVKEQFKTDYYILDKFPASARPFYTMPDPEDSTYTNSFDIFMRGQEILTGGQRIHDATFLEKQMKKGGVKPESMEDYMEGFRWGAPPHAGAGIGLERLLYLFLNLGNIRLASLFPRDPKSLPEKPKLDILRHPEASTTKPPWERDDAEDTVEKSQELQPLEKLIANYGDAANTSWLDERYQVWRHEDTGAAQGWVESQGHAIVVGEPLCASSQTRQVTAAFLHFLKQEHKHLKPIWILVGEQIEEHLGDRYSWRTLSVIAEERADPRSNPASKDHDVARKVRHAEKEGVKNIDMPADESLPSEWKERVNKRIEDWQGGRKGTQVHLTEIRPWVDEAHRRYFYAADGSHDGKIHALVVLHQLSPEHGYQVKFSLEFPDAPSGTIEALTLHAFTAITASDPDVQSVTFGTGATNTVEGGRNIGKHRVKALTKTYDTINKSLHLTNKSEFRAKLGAKNDPVYICYPKGGLGPSGIKAILNYLQEDGS